MAREPFILNPATRRRVVEQVAKAGHACWRARRAQARVQARTGGPSQEHETEANGSDFVDADSTVPSTADVPFSKLSPADREYLCRVIIDDDLLRTIADSVWFPEGPDRPMPVRDLYIGKPIAFRAESEPTTALPADPTDLGAILSWEPEPGSVFPRSITVRWNNGEVTTHSPFTFELRLVDEALVSPPPTPPPRTPQPHPPRPQQPRRARAAKQKQRQKRKPAR